VSGPEFSIVTCSIDAGKYAVFSESARAVFGDSAELVLIDDATSLCEGFTRGTARARADLLVFCHDDLVITEPDFAELLREDLARFDLVGVAGASRLMTGSWVAAGYPHLHGQIVHGSDEGYRLLRYDCGRDEAVTAGMKALDGVLIATHRRVVDQIGFDAKRFDAFHLYDLDFSFRSACAGFTSAVDKRLGLVHFSGGSYDRSWRKYAARFERKHRDLLDPIAEPLTFYPNTPFERRIDAVAAARRTARPDRSTEGRVMTLEDGRVLYAEIALTPAESAALDELAPRCTSGSVLALTGREPIETIWSRVAERVTGLGLRAVAARDRTILLCPDESNRRRVCTIMKET